MQDISNRRDLNEIVIVGGGTAGWLTALMAKKYLPKNCKITLIESEEIGILGAGEGTLVNFSKILNDLEISLKDILNETSATIKNGVKFVNWNGDGKHVYDSIFNFNETLDILGGVDPNKEAENVEIYSHLSIFHKIPSEERDLNSFLSASNKVPYIKNKNNNDFIKYFSQISPISFHFDASKMAKFLRKIGELRGIKRIEGKVLSFNENKDNEISSIVLENNNEINCDFIFDCSGFARLIIGKHYKKEWVSHKEYLPVDYAVPFFIPQDKDIPSYTEAVAMKYGWLWKAPLQHRYGCGYTFDSSYITEEEAIKEIEEYLGFEPEYPRKNKGGFKFNAGYYKESFVKNCIAIGLSAGFLEPLESSSLLITAASLHRIFSNKEMLYSKDEIYCKRYNYMISLFIKYNVEFISFHYLTNRKDTDFWKNFKKNNLMPEFSKELIKTWNLRAPSHHDLLKMNDFFPFYTWYVYGAYSGNISSKFVDKIVVENNLMQYSDKRNYLKNMQKELSDMCMEHREFILDVKSGDIKIVHEF